MHCAEVSQTKTDKHQVCHRHVESEENQTRRYEDGAAVAIGRRRRGSEKGEGGSQTGVQLHVRDVGNTVLQF